MLGRIKKTRIQILCFLLSCSFCLVLFACSSSTTLSPPLVADPINLVGRSTNSSSRLYYVNGLATPERDARNNLELVIRPLIESDEELVRSRLEDAIDFDAAADSSYELGYNIALGPVVREGASPTEPIYQIVASFAQKLQEVGFSENSSWQIARGFVSDEDKQEVILESLRTLVDEELRTAEGAAITIEALAAIFPNDELIQDLNSMRISIEEIVEEVSATAIQLTDDVARLVLADIDRNFDKIKSFTGQADENIIGSMIADIQSGRKIVTISNSQGTIFTGLAVQRIAQVLGEKAVRCNYSGVQVANMMGSTISNYRETPLYVTFTYDEIVNLVRRGLQTANSFGDPLGLLLPMPGNVGLGEFCTGDSPLGCHRLNPVYLNLRPFLFNVRDGGESRRKILQRLGDAGVTLNPFFRQCEEINIRFSLTPLATIPLPAPAPPSPLNTCDDTPSPPPSPQPQPTPIFPPSFEDNIPYRLDIELLDSQGNLFHNPDQLFATRVVALNQDSNVFQRDDYWEVLLTKDLGTLEVEIQITPIIDPIVNGLPLITPSIQYGVDSSTQLVTETDQCNLSTVDDCFEEEEPEDPEPPECIDPTPPPPPPPPPPCRGNCGSSVGDPHYTSLDGLYYDFQGAGEYTLIRSDDGQFVVQTRMQSSLSQFPRATVNTGVATQVGSQRINVLLPNVLVIDGEVVEGTSLDLPLDGGRLTRSGNAISIFWDTGDFISVSIRGGYIDVRVQPDMARTGQVSGLLGNFSRDPMDDIRTADGIVLNKPINIDDLYKIYGESWRITQEGSLFFYGPGESTQTFTDPGFPKNPRTPEQIFAEDPQRAAQAEATCQAQGITDPILLGACNLDVFLTGDPGFATGFTDEATVVTPEVAAEIESVIDTVNTLDDENGENPENCSLREAIIANNMQDGFGGCVDPEGTITFAPSLNGGTITLTASPLQITQNVVIDGPGSSSLAVSGNNQFRVFHIFPNNSPVVTIQGLTLTQGLSNNGGAILSSSSGLLTIDSVTISNSTCRPTNAGNGDGGGINARTLMVSNSTLNGNSARFGGGITATTATVSNSTLSDNIARFGGGINANTATVSNSILSGNSAGSLGGGIRVANAVTVSNSTLSGNSASSSGGGINAFTATVSNSTLSGNSSGFLGGSINAYTVTVSNSTLSGNSEGMRTGGINPISGTVSNSTLILNRYARDGKGILRSLSGSFVVNNTIVAGNTNEVGTAANDIKGLTDGMDGNIVGVSDITTILDPTLAANGTAIFAGDPNAGQQPVLTHALVPNSPVIDAGDNSRIPADATTDQRGLPRIVNTTVDIGSFEVQ